MISDERMEYDFQSALQDAADMWRTDGVVFDTETTGLGPDGEIVEIAVVGLNGETLIDTLVKPTRPIPPDATAVHGIGNENVAGAPTMPELLPALTEVLRGRHLMAYNFWYDQRLLRQSVARHGLAWPLPLELLEIPGNPPNCIMKVFAKYSREWSDYYGNYKWHRLCEAAEECEITAEDGKAHRALEDARVALAVL